MVSFPPIFWPLSQNKKLELIILKKLTSRVMKKISNIIICLKNYCKLSDNSLVMIAKQQIRINYIEEIILKSDAKNMKYYQMSKKF